MQTTRQQTKKELSGTGNTRKHYRARPGRFILNNRLDDAQGITSLFTLNEYGYRVISGKRIC